MRTEEQTSIHLLLASVVSIFGVMLILIIIAMSWEAWMVPVILIGNSLVWCLHIGRTGSGTFYENLCSGLLMIGFFFFGVHSSTLFDIPAVACIVIFIFSMFDKKRLLYMAFGLYILVLLYHFFILHTINHHMGTLNILRLMIGIMITAGTVSIAKYRINRRHEVKKRYNGIITKLEKTSRQNAGFLSNVSHELRTPINMVLGISGVLLDKDIPPEIQTDVFSIQIAGKRLSNQINNMLDYTEIVEGTLVPAQRPYMITSALNDIITMTAMQSNRSHLEMVFDIDPSIPAVLIGDVEKISHVLKILLENSLKFTEEGGINVCIGYRRESYGINLIIDIYDTGIGMTETQIEQMCDDFYQVDSGSSRFAGGLGLGLPIARGLLDAMGGFFFFDSEEQQGLQVHITIPQGIEDDTPAIVVSHPEKLCIACYFRPERFNSDEVKKYYDNMILHMVEGLGIEGYKAHNFDGLLKLMRSHTLTHVFISQSEYEENSSYYEDLTDTIQVVVIVEQKFMLDRNSKLLVIRKPFFALSVVNLLNGEATANEFGEAQAAGRRPFSCQGVRVLAVDDEEMNLVVAKGVLDSYGIQVDTCLSGKEALERCADTSYDIVFLDHMMPGFDGVQTMKQLREINNGIYRERPVIALTANTISGAREMFRNEGFTEFIPKPIEHTVLERVLRKVLPEECVQYNEAPVNPDSPSKDTVPQKKLPNAVPESDTPVPEKEASPENIPKKAAQKNILQKRNRLDKKISKKSVLEKIIPKADSRKKILPKEDVSVETVPETDIPEKSLPKTTAAGETKPETDSPEKNVPAAHISKETVPKEDIPERTSPKPDIPEEAAPAQDVSKDYAQEESVPQKDAALAGGSSPSFISLSQIGVNVQLGLDYCCGEESFYLEMLEMFSSQAGEKKKEIISLYEDANWEDYTVKVHALKSTSMTIGAERLAEQALLLEQAGKNNDTEYIRRCHPTLLCMYDEICEAIAGLLIKTGGNSVC